MYKVKAFVIIIAMSVAFLGIGKGVGRAQNSNQSSSTKVGKLQKPRVAIANPIIEKGISRKALSHLNLSILVSEMEASIRATRKFEVLTRQKSILKIIRKEQVFAKSNLAKGNAAKEGELENANYMIIPLVQVFHFYRTSKPIPNISGKYLVSDVGLLQINTQIIDTNTGQIKATFSLKSSFSTKQRVTNHPGGVPSSSYFTKMAKNVSAQIADQLVDTVFPMIVINVDGDFVWINRGRDGGLKIGQILNVYRPGKELIDPYTKESLGTSEIFIGKVKVIRVNPKFTVAKIVKKGIVDTVQMGYIIRKP